MLVVVEGIDGAGKKTQAALLQSRAAAKGLKVACLSFPRYGDTLFSSTIADYLNGKFGTIDTVPPEFSSLLFAGDRFESRRVLEDLMRENDLVVLDRYVSSNIAYHAARVPPDDREQFISWLSRIEYEIFGMPRPDLTIFLDVPAELSVELVLQKEARSYTTARADIHESRKDYMYHCREIFKELIENNFGGDWKEIDCLNPDGSLRAPEEISYEIWEAVSARLHR